MREEKEGFNKTYKKLVFLNFLAVAIFPSLFFGKNLVMLNLSQNLCLLLLSLIPALGSRAIPVSEVILLS